MELHPSAEAYRQALADGDHTGAASLLMEAHQGTYNSNLIDQFHAVGRMTRAQLAAPAAGEDEESAGVIPQVRVESRMTIFRRR